MISSVSEMGRRTRHSVMLNPELGPYVRRLEQDRHGRDPARQQSSPRAPESLQGWWESAVVIVG
jgi:hypothetical protein